MTTLAPDPENELVRLRQQVINPTPSTQVQQLQTRVGAGSTTLPAFNPIAATNPQFSAFRQVNAPSDQFQGIEAGNPLISRFQGPAADVSSLRGTLVNRAEGLTTAPDRAALAADAFDIIQQRGEPQYQQRLRQVGQKAAAWGRIGAGQTTNELGDVATLRERDLGLARRELANNAAAQSLADRLGIVSSLSGVYGGLSGEDRATDAAMLARESAQANEGFGLRAEARGERGDIFDLGQRARGEQRTERGLQRDAEGQDIELGFRGRDEARGERSALEESVLRRMGVDSAALGQLEGIESGRRSETRGERSRADVLAEIANDRRIQQQVQEQAQQQQMFDQILRRAGISGSFGFGGITPLDAAGGLTQEAGRQGDQFSSTGMQALVNFFLNQNRQANPPTPDWDENSGYGG